MNEPQDNTPDRTRARDFGPRGRLWLVGIGSMGLLLAVLRLPWRDLVSQTIVSVFGDTRQAPGYSEAAFLALRAGATEDEVRRALGPALLETPAVPECRWFYGESSLPGFGDTGEADGSASWTQFVFDPQGRFVEVFGQVAESSGLGSVSVHADRLGADGANSLAVTRARAAELRRNAATRETIAELYGPPSAVHESRAVRVLHYTTSPSSTHYFERVVGIDSEGCVAWVRARIVWD